MVKDDGSFNPASCRVFGAAAYTLAALMAAVIRNLKQTRRARCPKNRNNPAAGRPEQATAADASYPTPTIPHPPGHPHNQLSG